MDILDGLNPEQEAAVKHGEGPQLVVAGAGTGKTQVITRRIAYLIQQGKAKPSQVLALTFTEKAAREMQDRLYGLIGWQSFQVPVMTFHAFGADLLGRFAAHVGRSIRGGLLNDMQKALLLQQHISRVELGYYGLQANQFEFLEGVVSYIGELQNSSITVADYERHVAELELAPGDMHEWDVAEQLDLARLYRLYETVKEETGSFDYNDQLQLPLAILRSRPNLIERLKSEYRFVLVDEYQDTNAVQDQLLRSFIGSEGNLFAVGDDDQAIYGFRGADIGNILAFAEHFKLDRPVVLVRNYRSGQAVLDAAYRLIQNNNPERLEAKLSIDKRLIAQHDDSMVEFTSYRTPMDEQVGIIEAIAERIARGEQPDKLAVLAATHAPLKLMAKAMRGRGIPYALATSASIFEQPELIGLWYLMRWLVWQADDEAIAHVVMGPLIGWSSEDCRGVIGASREQLIGFEEALRLSKEELAKSLCLRLDEWRIWAAELSVSQVVFKLVFDTGRADDWRSRSLESARMVRVFEDLQRLLEHMQDYETVAINTTLIEYMKAFPKPPTLEVTEPTGDVNGVQLLTVHASKGLEFETVYIMGCSQRSWSGARVSMRPIPEALKPPSSLPPEHEFRRLMYVAVTRARSRLILSAPIQTNGGAKQTTSVFISELFGDKVLGQEASGGSVERLQKVMQKLQQFYPLQLIDNQRLPFENAEGWVDLSITALGSYEYCPFEFYLEKVLGIQQPLGPQIAFGNALHKVFEHYYKAQLGGYERETKELHELLGELWSDRGYETAAQAEADLLLAHRTLDQFLLREVASSRKILGSEVPVTLEVPEAKLRLRGKIDAYFETTDGVELRDFKTGRTKTDPEKLAKAAKENFQLRSYALAYELHHGTAPASVTLDYVVTEVEGSATLTPAILRNHRQKLGTLVERIRARDFAPNPSPMHVCAAIRYYGTGEADELLARALGEPDET